MKLRRPLSAFSAHPGCVALLWFAVAAVDVAIVVVAEDDSIGPVSSSLHLSGAPVLAALVASAILGLRTIALRLMTALLAFVLIGGLVMLTAELLVSPDSVYGGAVVLTLMAIWYLLLVVLIWRSFAALASRKRRMAAILAVTFIYALAGSFKSFDDSFYRLSYAYSQWAHPELEEAEEEAWPEIEEDILWEAQPALIEKSAGDIAPSVEGRANIYAMAVAAQGTDDLFSREATEALKVVKANYGDRTRSAVLLSNGPQDQMHVPLATRSSVASITARIGQMMSPADILVVYLTSHGSRDAELSTLLPRYRSVQAIGAKSLAIALDKAKIRRRIIIVSACYSGSWIPELANSDTIVITAAKADRTSFGCSDERRLTYFGEALLEGSLRRGASLATAFEDAKGRVARWEARDGLTPSLPQASVGKNMKSLWIEVPDGTKVAKP